MDWVLFASTIGLSSIISSCITFILSYIKIKKEKKINSLLTEKEKKYQHLLALLLVLIDENNILHMDSNYIERIKKLNSTPKKYCEQELEVYKNYMYFYASKSVIVAIEEFDRNKNYSQYKKIARAMYKDLWK